MTQVIFRENGNHFQFVESGHCGSEAGCELICAACSALAQTLAQGVNDCREMLAKEPSIRIGSGSVSIDALTNDDAEARAVFSGMFRLMKRGYMTLEKKYPEYVAVGRNETADCARVS